MKKSAEVTTTTHGQRLAVGFAIVFFVAAAIALWYSSGTIRPPVVLTKFLPETSNEPQQAEIAPAKPVSVSDPLAAPDVQAWASSQQGSPLLSSVPSTVAPQPALYSSTPATDALANLLAYFPFDAGFGNKSSFELPMFRRDDEVVLSPGLVGRAAKFDGSGASIEAEGVGSLPIGNELTVEFWVRPDDWRNPYKGSAPIESIVSHSSVFTIAIGAENAVARAALTTQSPADGVRLIGGEVSSNTWHHVALVYHGASELALLFVDGQIVDTAQASGNVQLNPQLTLSLGTWYKTNQAFSGALDELRIWDRALSADLLKERAGALSN